MKTNGGIFATLPLAVVLTAGTALAQEPGSSSTILEAQLARIIDKQSGLKADDVARRSASTSPKLEQKRAELEAASAKVDRAIAAYLPSSQLSAKYTRLSHVDATPPFTSPDDATSIQASLILPISDYALRIVQSHAAASSQEKAAELTAQATQLSIMSDARLGYYEWARSRLQLIVTAQALEQAHQHLRDAQSAFDAGTASRADVYRVEAQVAQTEQLDVQAKNLARVLEERLRISMHDEGNAAYALGEDLLADQGAGKAAQIAELDALVLEALERRIEPRVIEANSSALDSSRQALRATYFPRLNAFTETTIANPNQRYVPAPDELKRTWSAGLEISWSPSALMAASADVDEATARIKSLEAESASLADAIRLEVTDAHESIATARSAVTTSGRALAAAEEAYRVRQELFRSGRATSVELTDAETELTRAGLEAINARIDLRVAFVRFEHATGRDVTNLQ